MGLYASSINLFLPHAGKLHAQLLLGVWLLEELEDMTFQKSANMKVYDNHASTNAVSMGSLRASGRGVLPKSNPKKLVNVAN